jgi:DNA-binding NarL/FixJ family response regulator
MADRSSGLTNRQVLVVRGLAAGCTILELAAEMHVSERTVKNEIQRACLAMGARNRTQLVALAADRGLLRGVNPK